MHVQIVGGTKRFLMDVIRQINPDLIIANKEENYKEGIEALAKNYPIWISDVNDFTQAIDMIQNIGLLTRKETEASLLIEQIKQKWHTVNNLFSGTILYFIWNDPIMVVGKSTYINQILNFLGFQNAMKSYDRYPELNNRIISDLTSDYVFCPQNLFHSEKSIKNIIKIFSRILKS